MAKEDDDKKPEPEEDEADEAESEDEGEEDESEDDAEEGSDESEAEDEEGDEDEDESDDETKDEADEDEEGDEDEDEEGDEDKAAEGALAKSDDEGEPDGVLPAQLGVQKYVYSAFFGAMIVGGYILGRAIETIWTRLVDSEWVSENLHAITTIPEDTRATYSLAAAGLIAVIVGIRQYRKDDVRRWTEDVSSELLKVKWPTRKDVYASTVVVLATSAVAVTYLFLLDRFFGFLTDKIYGIGA